MKFNSCAIQWTTSLWSDGSCDGLGLLRASCVDASTSLKVHGRIWEFGKGDESLRVHREVFVAGEFGCAKRFLRR